jgi:SAM-dependent methyltransferase
MPEDLLTEMTRRYEAGDIPWDDPAPPPEVIALADALPPGRALDLGCGYGRASIYLAQRGWECDGVDFVAQAIAVARQRARDAAMADRAHFHVATVNGLAHLAPGYDLAIDVGCLHAQRSEDQRAYAAEVARLVAPGGLFVLFARVDAPGGDDSPPGLALITIRELFDADFDIERGELGHTVMPDDTWTSVWVWMRRKARA